MIPTINLKYLMDPRAIKFREPNLDFVRNQATEIQYPIEGIQEFGPFDYNMSERVFGEVKFLVLIPNSQEYITKIERLLNLVRKGSGNFRGFQREFHLDSVIIPDSSEFYLYNLGDQDHLQTQISSLIRENDRYSESSRSLNIVLACGPEHKIFRYTPQYDFMKRLLVSEGYPEQYLSNHQSTYLRGSLAQVYDDNFVYTLWNILIGIYSKLGGIPWTLKNPLAGKQAIDISVGVRFARTEEKDNENFTIGIATIFERFGRWRGINTLKYSDSQATSQHPSRSTGLYVPEEKAYELINSIIHRYERWKLGKRPNSVVIHKLGYYNRQELEGFIAGLENEGVESMALIEIISNTGLRILNTRTEKENIDRGFCKQISPDSAILCTTGNQKYVFRGRERCETHTLGTPKPLIVRIRFQRNCFDNPIIACKHVFALTSLHWQYLWKVEDRLPATLDFAQKIAKLFSINVIPHDNLLNTTWFL
ncbi:MAG: Piwi domain-containing protein [Candidatus Freyarchaeota archaeon]